MKPNISNCAKTIISLTAIALLSACHKEEPKPNAPAETPAKPAIVSAEKTSFDEVTSKLDKGGNLYVYLSTEKVLSGLSSKIDSLSNFVNTIPGIAGPQGEMAGKIFNFADAWIKDSGVEQISGVGMSSIAREPGFYYSKFIVHHYPGQNDGVIWSMMGKQPHPLTELDLLPLDTVLAFFSDFDVPLLWSNLQSHLKPLDVTPVNAALEEWPGQFQKLTGLDFDKTIASLGGNYGFVMTLDPTTKISLPLPSGAMEIPSPGLAIIVKVNSDVIFDRVDALCKGNPLVVRVDNADLKMRTMTIPIPLPIDLRPSIARSGDYLLLATSDTMIQNILDVKSGKKKGFKSTAEFTRLSQGIPDQGNNLTLVAGQFMKTMAAIQSEAISNKGSMTPQQAEAFQHVFNQGTNGGSFSVGANGAEGWEGYANGSQSLQSAVIPMVAGVGIAATIAIPQLIKAHHAADSGTASEQEQSPPDNDTAQYNQIIKNLRQLQTAKQKWAKEKGKEKGDTATMEDLAPYLQNGPIKPVDDEEYNPQPIGSASTAKLAHDLHGHSAGSEISAPSRKKKAAAT